MQIDVKITHTLAPEVLDLIRTFLGAAEAAPVTAKPETPVKSIAPKKADKKETPAPAPEAKAADPEPAKEPAENDLTLEAVRAVAVPLSKAGHKDAIKAKINELAGKETALPSLESQHYPALMDFLNTLK